MGPMLGLPVIDDTSRGRSSAGRAPALQAGGHRFEPVRLHHSHPAWMAWSSGLDGLVILLWMTQFDCARRDWLGVDGDW